VKNAFDFVIVGGGITGLAVVRALQERHSGSSFLILEKEGCSGAHSSGRNSGVLHSGIYYKEDSLKAKFCAEGRRLMAEYCQENNLPLDPMGKVIVPTRPEDDPLVDMLYKRAQANGATAEIIDSNELKKIEPFVRSASGRALYSPKTSVVDPNAVLNCLLKSMKDKKVSVHFEERVERISDNTIFTDKGRYGFGHLVNCAGAYADKIARHFGIASEYTMLPFKGLYYKLSSDSGIKLNGLVYPVPDLNVPFLGVHTIKSIDGTNYFGPTAIPAFGRENYQGFTGVKVGEALDTSWQIFQQYLRNQQGFRNYAHAEAFRFFKSRFAEAARKLIPDLDKKHLLKCAKVGIRGQLLNKNTHELMMDFLVENAENSTHVLNIVSPGFTSSFSFAKYIADKAESKLV
jgi:L-2-hydroxyglutarate oxidase